MARPTADPILPGSMGFATRAGRLFDPGSPPGLGELLFLGGALLPSAVVGLILWAYPMDQLTADHTALAARDYTALWSAGRLAAEHAFAVLADPAQFTQALRSWFGAGIPDRIWAYPPPVLLLAAPLALAPLATGFVIYTGIGPCLLWAALRAGGVRMAACTAVLLSPAVADNALAGQNGTLIAAAMLGGLLLVDRRPTLAGALLGTLILKPQLGLLVPVCLLAGKHWRALAVAGGTAAALGLASLLLFGLEPWTEFLFRARPAVAAFLEAPWDGSSAQSIFASPFMAARSLGASASLAYALQAAVALLCLGLAWQLWHVERLDPALRMAVTATLALAAPPWVHSYDMPPLAAASAVLVPWIRPKWRVVLGFAWVWPGLVLILPIPPIVSALSVASVALLGLSAAWTVARARA